MSMSTCDGFMKQLLMLVEEVLLVMGLRLLSVVTMERSGRDEHDPRIKKSLLTGIKDELRLMKLMKGQ